MPWNGGFCRQVGELEWATMNRRFLSKTWIRILLLTGPLVYFSYVKISTENRMLVEAQLQHPHFASQRRSLPKANCGILITETTPRSANVTSSKKDIGESQRRSPPRADGGILITKTTPRPANVTSSKKDNSDSLHHNNRRSNETCVWSKISRPGLVSQEGLQQVVKDSVYMLGAFWDERGEEPEVRLVGAIHGNKTWSLHWCQLWYENRNNPIYVPLNNKVVPENHRKRYNVVLLSCTVPGKDVPDSVAFTESNCAESHVAFQVQHHYNKSFSGAVEFSVCVGTLNKKYNNVNQLVEMMEVHRLFGAQKFIFHDYESSDNVHKYLQYYQKQGIVEVIPWKLPKALDDASAIWYYGQLVIQLDCLYRSLYTTKYLAYLDMDELLVPRNATSWPAMIAKYRGSNSCAFNFQHVFYNPDWPSEDTFNDSHPVHKYVIKGLQKLRRYSQIWEREERSKYIADVKYLIIPGIHYAWTCRPESRDEYVKPSEGMLHHYKVKPKVTSDANETDAALTTFTSEIVQRVWGIHEAVNAG